MCDQWPHSHSPSGLQNFGMILSIEYTAAKGSFLFGRARGADFLLLFHHYLVGVFNSGFTIVDVNVFTLTHTHSIEKILQIDDEDERLGE